jgi:hypothetical protein
MLLSNYLATLALTVLVETIVALLFHHKERWTTPRRVVVRVVVLINLMTHPALTYLLWLNAWMEWMAYPLSVAILEISVVVIEWRLLAFALGGAASTLFFLSLAMNLSSFIVGLIVLPL